MKWILLVAVMTVACSPELVTKPPAFNVVCLSGGDTLFASDSVYTVEPPQSRWGKPGDNEWRGRINPKNWDDLSRATWASPLLPLAQRLSLVLGRLLLLLLAVLFSLTDRSRTWQGRLEIR